VKFLGCFLVLPFVLIAIPAQASDIAPFGGLQHQGKLTLSSAVSSATSVTINPTNLGVFVFGYSIPDVRIQNPTLGKALNIIQVSLGAAFSF